MRLGNLIKTELEEGKEKHVPVIELSDCAECAEKVVTITVGKQVPHPNTIEHHIKWISLYGVKDRRAVHVATFSLGPTFGIPTVSVQVNVDVFIELIATEYCNIHGLWEGSLKL